MEIGRATIARGGLEVLHAVASRAAVDSAALCASSASVTVARSRHITAEGSIRARATTTVVRNLGELSGVVTGSEVGDGRVAALFTGSAVNDLVIGVAGAGDRECEECKGELHGRGMRRARLKKVKDKITKGHQRGM